VSQGAVPNVPHKTAPSRSDRCAEAPPAQLVAGIEQFNRQLYWEQHETLEAIWIREPDPIRYLYQGILQVGVGFYHWRRGNWHGARTKLAQGLAKLQPFRPACMSVDVERLCLETEALLNELEPRGRQDLPAFPQHPPRVHLIPA
jgi:predicted metal-dependent hydrolase